MGNILWAKLLLRRIEEPMRRFKAHPSLMQSSKDSKKIVKMYNKVARALVEFETLWHNAWSKSIEAARSGLQATLIIRHPHTGKLCVNFDREILQLVREAKSLQVRL
jgi:dynein heavy chain